MAYTTADVEQWMGQGAATLVAPLLARVKVAVDAWAAQHYDLTGAGGDADQALIMQCARLYTRKHSPDGIAGADDLTPIRVQSFDVDVQRLLAPYLKVSGLFGPTAATLAAE